MTGSTHCIPVPLCTNQVHRVLVPGLGLGLNNKTGTQWTFYIMGLIHTGMTLKTTPHKKSQMKRDQLDPPVIIWVLKNNVAPEQEFNVGWPMSLIQHQVWVIWGFHTPAQQLRPHPLTLPTLHKHIHLDIPVTVLIVFLCSLGAISSRSFRKLS